jgi:hypothetical protein
MVGLKCDRIGLCCMLLAMALVELANGIQSDQINGCYSMLIVFSTFTFVRAFRIWHLCSTSGITADYPCTYLVLPLPRSLYTPGMTKPVT